MAGQNRKYRFWHHHSLSIVSATILLMWIVLYSHSSGNGHLSSFYGNAIADWSGLLVIVLATKYFYEIGSAESRRPTREPAQHVLRILHNHSLVIFLVITGAGWAMLYVRMAPDAKWGQVVGNLVSEWTQTIGLVVLTKKLVETHSKESRN